MNKNKLINKKHLLILLLVSSLFILTNCNFENSNNHECIESTWSDAEDSVNCLESYESEITCVKCHKVLKTRTFIKAHDTFEIVENYSCDSQYNVLTKCHNCDYEFNEVRQGNGHKYNQYIIKIAPSSNSYGVKYRECEICKAKSEEICFSDNTFSYHGALSVKGRDLVDSYNQPFQLIGLSTHGLQWFSRYVNYESFSELKNEFGINVIRLALYTGENGYCTGNESAKKNLYETVVKGIEIATELDMYVIIDWHMLGAVESSDRNPLTYVEESKEFFGKISSQFKNNKNILYEIMNEPSGPTTWNDCRNYANQVIPVIRANTDAIILVGNARWSADLTSVMKNPLTGYDNIMYTYHFYAADHRNTSQVSTAYDQGFPVFITEHGGMYSDGDGLLNYNSIRNWYNVLDTRNISYVAWCIANSAGSSSIIKENIGSLDDFSDENLKIWGRWYKMWTRTKAGLPVYGYIDEQKER